jgi:hypothetical protein
MRKRLGAWYLFFATLSLAGCGAQPPDEDVANSENGMLGGIPARSKKYDAVGALYGVKATGPAPICTGTLIGPHTVLAAGHCVHPKGAPFNIIDRYPVYFAIGYDSAAPTQTIRAVWGGTTPVAEQDIGIYQLEEEPEGVEPIPIADGFLTADDLGDKLTMVGFGLHDDGDDWLDFLTRRAGKMTLTTFDPQPLHGMFPTVDEFKTFMEANAGKTFTPEAAQYIYDWQLLQAGDAFLGGVDEPQAVYLDSGGPALRKDGEGQLRVHGVNSRGYRADPTVAQTGTASDLLPVGTAIAMIGHPDTTALITASLADPCRNITSGGHCSATLAVRCGVELDPPIISVLDCAEFGAVCKVDAAGEAGCDDP